MKRPKDHADEIAAWTSRLNRDLLVNATAAERRAIDDRMHALLKAYHQRMAEVLA